MSRTRRIVISAVLTFGFLSMLADWFGWFGRGWGWYPENQHRELTAPEG